MNFFAYNRMGESIHEPSVQVMKELLASVSSSDPEHPDVSLNTGDGWCLSFQPSHIVIFENVETGEGPWHLKKVSSDSALELWRQLSQGKLAELRALPWAPGYGA